VLPNLTALIVATPVDFEGVSGSIRHQIVQKLGSIAIPTFRVVTQLPTLPNGKLDRVTITNLYG
jgi:1,4-dihydroxy-2-naphthoate octaprenyltransferase